MKKAAIVVIILGLLALITSVTYKLNSLELHNNKQNVKPIKNMPLFEFKTVENNTFSKYDLDKNKATVIVYFDPDCGKCKVAAKIFYTFKKAHKDVQVLFVSSNTIEKTKAYAFDYKLDTVKNVNFYVTELDSFYSTFKEVNTPSYFIYDSKRKHIITINDEVPAKTLLRYIKVAQQHE